MHSVNTLLKARIHRFYYRDPSCSTESQTKRSDRNLPKKGAKNLLEKQYIKEIHTAFAGSDEDRAIFMRVITSPSRDRSDILDDLKTLEQRCGLSYALLALYRQQVNCGFVLADPLRSEGQEEKRFFDEHCGVEFRLLWNPGRELRKNHELLIQRGVVAKSIDESKLVNKDKSGKACYLCKENIALQNPAEILFSIKLAGEKYFAGANFAYITNNHFTIMNSSHRPQQYRKQVLEVLDDFVLRTGGCFRAIFNGLAGASIPWHEHMQATTEKFPLEDIKIRDTDVLHQDSHIRASVPFYYLNTGVVESASRARVEDAIDRAIRKWHSFNKQYHTENVIAAMTDGRFRMFLILRDTRKLAGRGKAGGMASFECGGNIVLSYEPTENQRGKVNERITFDRASVETAKQLLSDIAPDPEMARAAFQEAWL